MMIIDCNFMTFRDASGTQNDVEIYELRKQTESAALYRGSFGRKCLGRKCFRKSWAEKRKGPKSARGQTLTATFDQVRVHPASPVVNRGRPAAEPKEPRGCNAASRYIGAGGRNARSALLCKTGAYAAI